MEEYTAAFDEVRARTDQLDKESLQRLLIGLLGDPVWGKVEKEAAYILKSSSKALLAAPSHANLRYTHPRTLWEHSVF